MTLEQEIRAADRAYQRALRHPRGEGLDQAGARLQRLYARQRADRNRQLELHPGRSNRGNTTAAREGTPA